ncbi:dehydratase [Paralcaligenes sp. KSB-10]|uniref:MaoC/PaaZ C-terminal domain-containing protein n=1 Tax=Paralcaligenes sp. KSB-10 TaxID=2901142 RepID=UPI001E4961FF|nr:MaoC/PaaZ C-terminal domain-containing protein [Paralcaligenes sp. KSB-10]UHL63011.1 dehydratase [Paralcaligenes sp. KSB-10]
MIDAPYGDLQLGQKRASRGRTITESDVVNFCMLTGNWLELHSNVEFAKNTLYGERLVQGGLVFVIANALIGFDPELIEAFYGVDNMRFVKPTFINDTIYAQSEIIALRDKGEQHGVATVLLQATNQRREIILSCEFSLLVRRDRLAAVPEPVAYAYSANTKAREAS